MNTINYDFRYNYTPENNIDLSFGTNGMYQNSQNKGSEFLIPDYNLFDFGLFAIAKKSWDKWTLSGGLRYDVRTQNGKDLWLDENDKKTETPDADAKHLFKAFHTKFYGISGSVGATYQINDIVYTKLNFSKGFRAPNIAEISSNGVHKGTSQYLIGSLSLKSENSYQVDYAFGINSEHLTLETDLFYNQIYNNIFLGKLQNPDGSDLLTEGNHTFKYTQGNAYLYGGEITLDIHPHPLDWLHFENSFSYVQSVQVNQPDSMKYLPFTPAPKLHSEIRVNSKKFGKFLANSYVKIGVDNYFKQNHFYMAFGTETATPGYTLLNAGIGTDIVSKERTLFSIYISANNLINVAYQNHLSRLKYLDENNATGRIGVFNIGRNISFKLIIPIDIKK
ncbi:MAG: TonB-dependent receptor [Bacteroidetes bacterium]|nr:TonB-dependent receptor [Bacteroidota bacterium]